MLPMEKGTAVISCVAPGMTGLGGRSLSLLFSNSADPLLPVTQSISATEVTDLKLPSSSV